MASFCSHEICTGHEVREYLGEDGRLSVSLLLHLRSDNSRSNQRHIAEQLGEPEVIDTAHEVSLAKELITQRFLVISPGHVVDSLNSRGCTGYTAIEKFVRLGILIDTHLYKMVERLHLVVLQTTTAVAVV